MVVSMACSPLLRIWHERYAMARRKRHEKLVRDAVKRYEGYDRWARAILVPLYVSEEHAVGWNRERIRKIREEAEEMLTG